MKQEVILFISCFCLCSIVTTAQNYDLVDSLQRLAKKTSGTDKYLALHRIAAEYADFDNRKAFYFVCMAEEVALSIGDTLSIVKSQRLKSQILMRLGEPRNAIAVGQAVLHNYETSKFPVENSSILNQLGSAYLFTSQFDKALDYYFQTYEAAKQAGDSAILAYSIANIGLAYYKLKDYAKALPFLLKSRQMETRLSGHYATISMNISLCYSHLNKYNEARRYLQEAIDNCEPNCSPREIVHIKYASGCRYLGLRQYDSAEIEFSKSLEFSRQTEDDRMQLDNLYLLAKVSIQRNDVESARQHLEEGEQIILAGTPFNMEMIKVYEQLSELFMDLKDFERASFYQSRYIMLRDSIYDEKQTIGLLEIESKYLKKENEAKIAAKDEVILLKEEMIERQSVLNIVTILLTVAVTALLAVLLRSYKLKKNMNVLLDKKVQERTTELESREKLLRCAIHESHVRRNRASSILTQHVTTLDALCAAGARETDDQLTTTYFKRIRESLGALVDDMAGIIKNDDIELGPPPFLH